MPMISLNPYFPTKNLFGGNFTRLGHQYKSLYKEAMGTNAWKSGPTSWRLYRDWEYSTDSITSIVKITLCLREYIGWRRYTSQTEDISTTCDSTYRIQA